MHVHGAGTTSGPPPPPPLTGLIDLSQPPCGRVSDCTALTHVDQRMRKVLYRPGLDIGERKDYLVSNSSDTANGGEHSLLLKIS